jgi:hypothetical protein
MDDRTQASTVRKQTSNRALLNSVLSGLTLATVLGMFSMIITMRDNIGEAKGERALMKQDVTTLRADIMRAATRTSEDISRVENKVSEYQRSTEETSREQRLTVNQLQKDLASLTAEVRILVAQQNSDRVRR